jgi:hypothetical protein
MCWAARRGPASGAHRPRRRGAAIDAPVVRSLGEVLTIVDQIDAAGIAQPS